MRTVWRTLGITATNDVDDIRRAYAKRVKVVHPEDDAEGFQALRAAYDQALQMARNGWAVPGTRSQPQGHADDDARSENAEDWEDDAWEEPQAWAPAHAPHWAHGDGGTSTTNHDLPEDIRAELAKERDLAQAHQTMCDQLSAIIRDPHGDGGEALSAMLRIFRSQAMDSLSTYAHTERWLAYVVASGGPVADDLVEPAIQFFGWESTRVGVDLRHAYPVLERRSAGRALRDMDQETHPAYGAWQALKRKPTPLTRALDRLTPGLKTKVEALIDRLDHDQPQLMAHVDMAALAIWRRRLTTPGLGPVMLWILILIPPFMGFMANARASFGMSPLVTFMTFWAASLTFGLGLALAHLYGVARPKHAWQAGRPFDRPLWLRFGWVPVALTLPIAAGLMPPEWWSAAAVIAVSVVGWAWVTVTTSDVRRVAGHKFDWVRWVGILPIWFYLVIIGSSPDNGGLTLFTVLPAAVILQIGAEAVVYEVVRQARGFKHRLAVGQLVLGVCALAGVVLSAQTGVGMAVASAIVVAAALLDRTLAWNRVEPLLVARRYILLGGWVGGFLIAAMIPLPSFLQQAAVGLSAWLLLASTLTAAAGLADGRPILPERFRRKAPKRRPGSLA